MLTIKKITALNELNRLKAAYFSSANSALDGMWHFGFAPMSDHFGFYLKETLIGFCCVNAQGYMLQFHLSEPHAVNEGDLFRLICEGNSPEIGQISGAFVSTAEIAYLALCLDNASSFQVNALMYQALKTPLNPVESSLTLTLARSEKIADYVDFAAKHIGAPKAWLTDYYTNLIQRNELFGYWVKSELKATGECRLFDEFQTQYADLGLIVAQSERGKGLGCKVLQSLKIIAKEKGLTAICSTEKDNIPAQKAIEKAGFEAYHRLIQFEFGSV